jgi:hypothetical protein
MANITELIDKALLESAGEIKGEKLVMIDGEPAWVPENVDIAKLDLPEEADTVVEDFDIDGLADTLPISPEEQAERDEVAAKLGVSYGWMPESQEHVEYLVNRYLTAKTELERFAAAYKSNSGARLKEVRHVEDRYWKAIKALAGQNLEKGCQFARYAAGVVQFTKNAGGWRVADAKLLQEWCSRMSDYRRNLLGIKVKRVEYSWDLDEIYLLAEHLKVIESAEFIPGIQWEEPEVEMSIRPPTQGRKVNVANIGADY